MPTPRSSPVPRARKDRFGSLACKGCGAGGTDTDWDATYACKHCGALNLRLYRADHADQSVARRMSPLDIARELATADEREARA